MAERSRYIAARSWSWMLIIAHRKMSQQLWSPGGACRRPSFARAFRYAGPVVAVAGSTSTRCFIFSKTEGSEREIRRERDGGRRGRAAAAECADTFAGEVLSREMYVCQANI